MALSLGLRLSLGDRKQPTTPPVTPGDVLLLETGDAILLENGVDRILLEDGTTTYTL